MLMPMPKKNIIDESDLRSMEDQFNKLVKWILPPLELKSQKPYLKAHPIKPLDNNKILYEIHTNSGKKQVPVSIQDSFEMSTDGKLHEDMCLMNVLNQPQVLNNLVQRYKKDMIFTYIGSTLIVLNPYKYIPKYFDLNQMKKIRQKILNVDLSNDEPHTFMIAGKAYLHMKTSDAKQVIIISGQSGAGKSQSTKYCMKILTSLSHPQNTHKQDHHSVQQKILSCNPLLQAFGNSKTVRNDNSSRFGKYVQMYFGQDNTIKGANIQSYLLQKSRVVSIATGQRTFHAFYALIASKKFNVKQVHEYKILQKSKCYTAVDLDDVHNFNQINEAMQSIEFQKIQQEKIWLLLKAILQLGNIQFDDKSQQHNQQHPCNILNIEILIQIAEILQTNVESLYKILIFEKKVMPGQVIYKAYNKDRCEGHRNTLCKAIYNSIFEFIMQKIQLKLRPKNMDKLKQINILDIFGFENFQQNSLEQLCINFANQKLLRLYNEYIFKREMQLLSEDGLEQDVKSIKPPTNDDIIQMISGNGLSIFSIINDNTQQQQFTDQNIKSGIQDRFLKTNLITVNPKKKMAFTIKHSQCTVEYDVEGFKMKNLDKLNDDIIQIINNIKMLKCSKQSSQKIGRTLLRKFGVQIDDLIKQLSTSNVHFIRCIKPNEIKQPNTPIESYILSQVRYLGVFQTIQIRKKTFPVRKQYLEFANQYKMLFPHLKQTDLKKLAQFILREIKSQNNQFMLGHKRVYINERIQGVLNKKVYEYYKKRNQLVKKVQSVCKRFIFTSKVTRNIKILTSIRKIFKISTFLYEKSNRNLKRQVFQRLNKNQNDFRQQKQRNPSEQKQINKNSQIQNKPTQIIKNTIVQNSQFVSQQKYQLSRSQNYIQYIETEEQIMREIYNLINQIDFDNDNVIKLKTIKIEQKGQSIKNIQAKSINLDQQLSQVLLHFKQKKHQIFKQIDNKLSAKNNKQIKLSKQSSKQRYDLKQFSSSIFQLINLMQYLMKKVNHTYTQKISLVKDIKVSQDSLKFLWQAIKKVQSNIKNLQSKQNELDKTIKEKQQKIICLKQTEQKLQKQNKNMNIFKSNQSLITTKQKEQLNLQKQLKNTIQNLTLTKKQLEQFKISFQKLQQQNKNYIASIVQLKKDKQNLITQVQTLKQQITKIKAESQNKKNKFKQQSQQLQSILQYEKGKNQAYSTEIVSLKDSLTKLTEQKIEFKIQIQKMKLQFQNDSKQKIKLQEQKIRLKEQHAQKINNNYDHTQRRSFYVAGMYRDKKKQLQSQEQKIKSSKNQLEQQMKKFNLPKNNQNCH